jgi:hypothetical protein
MKCITLHNCSNLHCKDRMAFGAHKIGCFALATKNQQMCTHPIIDPKRISVPVVACKRRSRGDKGRIRNEQVGKNNIMVEKQNINNYRWLWQFQSVFILFFQIHFKTCRFCKVQ